MRKIVSKHDTEKKKRRNQLVIGGALILVMLLSTLGYAIQSNFAAGGNSGGANSGDVVYNGVTFASQNGFWIVNGSNGKRFSFNYNPKEISLQDLSGLTMNLQSIKSKPLYIYSYDDSAAYEMKINLLGIASSVNSSSTVPENPDCSKNSIIIKNESSGISQNGNCVFISGQGEDLIKLADNVLFKSLGITN